MKKTFAIAAAAMLLASCTPRVENIEGKFLSITELNGTELVTENNAPAFIIFEEETVNASLGCNSIFANYKMEKKGKVVLDYCGSTKMACPDELREDEFVAAINSVDHYTTKGGEVVFFDANGNQLFKTVEVDESVVTKATRKEMVENVENTEMRIVELNGTEITSDEEHPAVLRFEEGKMTASVGCNGIFADYTLYENGGIAIAYEGSTKMACPEGNREDEFIESMALVDHYTTFNEEVNFYNTEGVLVFKAMR